MSEGFYDRFVLPRVLNCICGLPAVMNSRKSVVPRAKGRVLEIGMGSGLNLSLYDPSKVKWVWGLEPSPQMRKLAQTRAQRSGVEVRWIELPSEKIPLESSSVDTVVLCFTLCTISDWKRALFEMKRVLKPDGQLLFCEHGLAPDPKVALWQDRLNSTWSALAGGCQLNRPTLDCLKVAGFELCDLKQQYVSYPKFASYISLGMAHKSPELS